MVHIYEAYSKQLENVGLIAKFGEFSKQN